jgi:hypothetical protein
MHGVEVLDDFVHIFGLNLEYRSMQGREFLVQVYRVEV